MAPSFYRDLDCANDEIRLLTLHPSESPSSQIRLGLRYVSLKDQPVYYALSYTWGAEEPNHPILINGETIMVRENLYTALCQFNQLDTALDLQRDEECMNQETKHPIDFESAAVVPSEESHSTLCRSNQSKAGFNLWCDALCINQEDISERNRQVLRMGDIYAKAFRVLIWLGEAEADTGLAFSYLHRWSDVGREIIGKGEKNIMLRPSELFQQLDPMLFDRSVCKAFRHLFKRPWWQRIWVIQEVLLAKDARLLCGEQQCAWVTYLMASMTVKSLLHPSCVQYYSEYQARIIPNIISSPWAKSFTDLESFAEKEGKVTLLQLFLKTRCFLATDPRDMLYGLLGLKKMISPLALDITINYKDPIYRVYSDLVRTFATQKRRLSLLGGAGIGYGAKPPSLDLPSWTPDFRKFDMIRIDHFRLTNTGAGAGGLADSIAIFSHDSRILSAQGVVCSIVTDVRLCERGNLGPDGLVDLGNFVISQTEAPYPTGISRRQAYFRTIIGDVESVSSAKDFPSSAEADRFFNLAAAFLYLADFTKAEKLNTRWREGLRIPQETRQETPQKILASHDYVGFFAFWAESLSKSPHEKNILEPFLGTEGSGLQSQWYLRLDSSRSDEYREELFVQFEAIAGDKALFVLEDGYFGIGPPGTMSGDRLCVLLGCEFPLLIRPRDQHYVLVGSCYVYGAMRGEFMEDVEAGKRSVETVVLR